MRNISTLELFFSDLRWLTESDSTNVVAVAFLSNFHVKDVECDGPEMGETVTLPTASRRH